MNIESGFRRANKMERELLLRLMEAEFPGRNELALMIQDILVRTIDEFGSLELQSQSERTVQVIQRVPVEAEAKDIDGHEIHIMLHVVDGRPVELEILKIDGDSILRMPDPPAFELVVLPPVPRLP